MFSLKTKISENESMKTVDQLLSIQATLFTISILNIL